MEVLLAKDIAPEAFDDSESYSDDENRVEDMVDDLEYDVFNLTAVNSHPFAAVNVESREEMIIDATARATRLLVKKIFSCPIEKTDLGPLAVLPEELFVYPREKKVPEVTPETRWEKYAKEKGIKKRKRERMIFDDDMQEWRPRYGYKRANSGIDEIPIVEVKHGQDPNKDPWEESRKQKKARVDKNMENRVKNQNRNSKSKSKLLKSYDSVAVPGIPLDLDKSKKRGKDGVRRALELVQHSTQSLGRFDDMREGEPKRKLQGRRRNFRDNNVPMTSEKDIMKSQIRIVADKVAKKAKGVTNSLSAYEGILPDAPTDSFKQKKGVNKVSKKRVKK